MTPFPPLPLPVVLPSPSSLPALATVEDLLRLPVFGDGLGLHRIQVLAGEELDSAWGRQPRTLHITGSNGKGSVAALASELLIRLGIRCGRYVSPHLLRFHERITVDRQDLPESALEEGLAVVAGRYHGWLRGGGEAASAFEMFTTLALWHFRREAVEAVVAEAGIGGRFDPTRVLRGPVAALVALDLEHTAILGQTLEQIAYEKADLCPPGGTLVVGPLPEGVRPRLEAYLRLTGVRPLFVEDRLTIRAVRFAGGVMEADIQIGPHGFDRLVFALPGEHQIANAALVWLLVRAWLEATGRTIPEATLHAAFRDAVARVEWFGRITRIAESPPLYIDVGHTPRAVAGVARTIRALAGTKPLVVVVVGVSWNKDAAGIAAALAPHADVFVCTRATHRGGNPGRVEEALATLRPEAERHRCDDLPAALDLARAIATRRGGVVSVAGGLFLAVESWLAVTGRPRDSVIFF